MSKTVYASILSKSFPLLKNLPLERPRGSMAYLQKNPLTELQYVRRPDKILTLYCPV